VPTLDDVLARLPEALLEGAFLAAFGVLLKLSDLLQEHGYRWFRGAALATGAVGAACLLFVLARTTDLHRVFWLVVLLHWVLRGRIDGVNHGLPTAAALVALAVWSPGLILLHTRELLYFAVPLTVLGLLHDLNQYTDIPAPDWWRKFLQNQHLYWYLTIALHPVVSRFDPIFFVAASAFVMGYGVLYSQRILALLPRLRIEAPPTGTP
jgi:hypothetical protein